MARCDQGGEHLSELSRQSWAANIRDAELQMPLRARSGSRGVWFWCSGPTTTAATISDAIKDLMKTYVQYPPRVATAREPIKAGLLKVLASASCF